MSLRIHSIKDIQPFIDDIRMERYFSRNAFMEFYRGHSKDEYKLSPGLFRYTKSIKELIFIEKQLLNSFNEEIRIGNIRIQESFLKDKYPHSETWVRMFQAQHLGLKTRLLDWTIDLEMAILFAVDNEHLHGIDGHIWIFKCPKKYQINDGQKDRILNLLPWEITESYMINYPFFMDNSKEIISERRRARQHGRFSIQPIEVGIIPLEEQDCFRPLLTKVIIDGKSKSKIKYELKEMGLDIDWAYFRREANIDYVIKKINASFIKN